MNIFDFNKATALVHELDALGFNVCNDNGRVRLTMLKNVPEGMVKDPHWWFNTVEEAVAFAEGFREAGFAARVLAAKPAKKAARREK